MGIRKVWGGGAYTAGVEMDCRRFKRASDEICGTDLSGKLESFNERIS